MEPEAEVFFFLRFADDDDRWSGFLGDAPPPSLSRLVLATWMVW